MRIQLLQTTEAWDKGLRGGIRWSHVLKVDGNLRFITGDYDGLDPTDSQLLRDGDSLIAEAIQERGLYDWGGFAIYNGDVSGPDSGAFVKNYAPRPVFEI